MMTMINNTYAATVGLVQLDYAVEAIREVPNALLADLMRLEPHARPVSHLLDSLATELRAKAAEVAVAEAALAKAEACV